MSTTKEVKTLLDELRRQLDPEQVPYVEPTLRKILDAAKPKTVTEVEYRGDPKDRAEIESLRATIHSKDETIRKLENKLADHPPPPKSIHQPIAPDQLSRKQRLDELNARAKDWMEWARRCMELMADNEDDLRQRKQLLTMFMGTLSLPMCNYLSQMEGLRKRLPRSDLEQLPAIVNKSLVKWLKDLADEIRQAKGVEVDLELFAKRPPRIVAAEPPQPYMNIERLHVRRPKRR